MMNESSTRKQDGDESFDLTEWLSNDVKLPQYLEAFLEHGFESPLECSTISEEDLNLLGVVKIGHRRRMLVSCQKLADKLGLSSQDLEKPGKGSDTLSEEKEQQPSSNNVQSPDSIEIAPVLPPKKAKKQKPAPPVRNMAEKEVNIDSAIQGKSSNVDVFDPTDLGPDLVQAEERSENTKDGGDTVHESGNSETSPGLPPGNNNEGYEAIWEASEGEPLPLSPGPQTDVIEDKTKEPVDSNANLDINTTNDEQNIQITEKVKKPSITGSNTGGGPPPIPPRADLEDQIEQDDKNKYVNVPSADKAPLSNPAVHESIKPSDSAPEEKVVSPKKKVAPTKPPRRGKNPVSMVIPSGQPLVFPPPRRSLGSIDQVYNDEGIYENEVFANEPPQQVETKPQSEEKNIPTANTSEVNEDANIYGNAENFQKVPTPVQPKVDPLAEKNRRPIPVPRIRSGSDKPKVEAVYDTIPGKKYM